MTQQDPVVGENAVKAGDNPIDRGESPVSKVVRIGEFARKQAAATAPRLVAARPALTPREIAHRFAMLAYLRKAR